MNRNWLPPLLRGIGTLILLFATLFAVITARKDAAGEIIKLQAGANRAKLITDTNGQTLELHTLYELMAETDDLRSELEEKSVIEDVIANRWFDWASLLGSAIIASSFFTEAFLRRRENG